ncbi:beta-1,3-glucan-binding protein-like [Diabrotica virgifera virgifera]|uniref:GH16 domain-containing protein n=2 Tax=Diabrotica virgifera virgifera TaxID=50390 RepID=A0ABM5KZN7_DIAVI|nr:beta-1,3-glucan-binding protein-like [Diabrotica virgifera virgifera]XP_050515653.1 beta-1,3-glucan-binding protein-like [Diabrotica virgifera virgifera]
MDRRVLVVLTVIVLLQNVHTCKKSITTVSGNYAPKEVCSGKIIFEDNFDELDLNKWNHEQTLGGGGNWEFQWYTNDRNNSYVKDGELHIRPTLLADQYGNDFLYSGTIDLGKECTNSEWFGCRRVGTKTQILNPIKSARLRTANSFSFKYGKVEIRAKIPAGDWLWPAIWLLPTYWKYGGWPTSGEIDMMESRGNRQLISQSGRKIGVQTIGYTLNWGPNPDNNLFYKTHFDSTLDVGYNQEFHKYQLEWTPDYIKFSIDDKEVGTIVPPSGGFWQLADLTSTGLQNPWKNGTKMAPFDQEFHLLINVAVGGLSYFPDNAVNTPGKKPWTNTSPYAPATFWNARNEWLPTWKMETDESHLKIDYVKVWAL